MDKKVNRGLHDEPDVCVDQGRKKTKTKKKKKKKRKKRKNKRKKKKTKQIDFECSQKEEVGNKRRAIE